MIRHADEERLRRLVGAATMVRGLRYAATGRVTRCEWDASGLSAVGEVTGTSSSPYKVSVQLTRRSDSTLADVEARCTCPVGFNCKHAVAIMLADLPKHAAADRPPAPSSPPAPSFPPALRLLPRDASPAPARESGWDEPLRALLASDREPPVGQDADGEGAGELAIQFELVSARPSYGYRQAGRGPGIRLRPVVRSHAGNWVRTGISWGRLDYYGYAEFPSPARAAQLALLRELRALHHAVGGGSPWAGAGDEVVWLESVNSRRLWDLLRQAGEAGIPLLRAGRDAGPVDLRTRAVDAVLDVTASDEDTTGLTVRPVLVDGDAMVDPARSLLIGAPAHGVVWWGAGGDANRTPELHLAPLSRPVAPEVAGLLHAGTLRIPARDVERFRGELYPQVRRWIPVRSSDGSVDLPEPAPDAVRLRVRAVPGPTLDLMWALVGTGGAARDLSAQPDEGAARTLDSLSALVAGGHQELVVQAPAGPRLAPSARLVGLDAARFVTTLLPGIEAVEGVIVERLGEIPDFREVTEAPVVRLGGEASGQGDWFDLQVEVTVGGEEVPFTALFLALAEGAAHLLLPSGAYFELDRPELRRLAELIAEARALHESHGPPGSAIRLSRFQASLWEDLQELGAADETARIGAWAEAVEALRDFTDSDARSRRRPLPAGLRATLRPYQEDGFQWLASRYEHNLGGILADDMGLGKTLSALALVCHSRETGLAARTAPEPGVLQPWLVVAPTSVVGNWAAEAARFAPDVPVVAVTETTRRRGVSLAEVAAGAGVVITSYALFRLDYDEYEGVPWAGLVLDEAQFAKNPASHSNQRARRLPVPFKLAMTGTPLENSLAELWALTTIVAPGLFSRQDRFAETYRTPIERHGDGERLDQLRRRIRPIMLRRTKEQVAADLPDKQEQVLELDLHPRHEKLYQTYLQRERQKILGLLGDVDGNRFEIFRSLTLLRQAALDVALVDDKHRGVPSTKLDALGEMLGDIVADGHRVLVFSQFTRFLTAARVRVEEAGIECCYLDGKTTKRTKVIDQFRNGDAPVFLISLKAGGFGLNLTEADYCVLLDPWWNPATEAQAVDRTHRIGQTRKVMVYRLVARNTIEEKVMALKARKAKLFDSVVGGGGFESGALTAADIRDLLG
ncbi:DEAD/DEAH box helicase [Acidiferrimicrobium sp. IK]|uniref:DEAD/DEAH box helicase n=1 Tax=Acidiferrimicrobium sp. IK TaxID=2871700 RepID=UPI0021CB216F|nr:DEAD/DEAH box helicase [Acidiferrimicrobium sp. IK]MCU4182798.1 DEAD/DEAH box helicase [Acidiferrimicrobium sp. IK]